jgi:zinc finger CCHC domain-containing protein 9
MARFTSIGMPKKSFVASTTEETRPASPPPVAPPAEEAEAATTKTGPKKRKRRGTRGLDPEEAEARRLQHQAYQKEASKRQKLGLGRDPIIASEQRAVNGMAECQLTRSCSEQAKVSAEHSEQRRVRREDQRFSDTTCFACRGVGHPAGQCPNVLLSAGGEDQGAGLKRKGGKKGGEVTGGKCYR